MTKGELPHMPSVLYEIAKDLEKRHEGTAMAFMGVNRLSDALPRKERSETDHLKTVVGNMLLAIITIDSYMATTGDTLDISVKITCEPDDSEVVNKPNDKRRPRLG